MPLVLGGQYGSYHMVLLLNISANLDIVNYRPTSIYFLHLVVKKLSND